MSDRVTCRLELGGEIPAALVQAILDGKFEDLGPPDEFRLDEGENFPDMPAKLPVRPALVFFEFSEISDGRIDANLAACLMANGVSFDFRNEALLEVEARVSWWRKNDKRSKSISSVPMVVGRPALQQRDIAKFFADNPKAKCAEAMDLMIAQNWFPSPLPKPVIVDRPLVAAPVENLRRGPGF